MTLGVLAGVALRFFYEFALFGARPNTGIMSISLKKFFAKCVDKFDALIYNDNAPFGVLGNFKGNL